MPPSTLAQLARRRAQGLVGLVNRLGEVQGIIETSTISPLPAVTVSPSPRAESVAHDRSYTNGSFAAGSRGYATNSHDILNVHMDEPHNNDETPFAFTEANRARVEEICSRYPSNWRQSAVIPVLDLAQQQNDGWLSLNAMREVARVLGMAEIRVFEVATFYTMFNRSKIGKYHVMVCGTTPCMLQGSKKIYGALKEELGVDYGQTTSDGMFTLGEMECMGACVNAPMIAIADYTKGVEGFSYTYYEDLTPGDVKAIVGDLRAGKTPKKGSQHRWKAEPSGAVVGGEKWVPSEGSKTLQGTPPGPYCRDLDEGEAKEG
mmetsp:Transcript_14570/g.41510  ORF Transcript_14570/g.41510 Transcript_14570/m.41510 type:complete len:318 (-) Transcript_14570:1049-2002(-)